MPCTEETLYGVFFYTFIHLDFWGQKSYNKAQTEL